MGWIHANIILCQSQTSKLSLSLLCLPSSPCRSIEVTDGKKQKACVHDAWLDFCSCARDYESVLTQLNLCELFFRVAVVTGGNKGIGLEVCRQLASRGVAVILTARDEKKGTEAVATLRGSGLPDVQFHRLDVSNPTDTARLAEFIKEKFGRLDILVRSLFSRKKIRIDLMRYGRSIAEPCEKSHTSIFHRGRR